MAKIGDLAKTSTWRPPSALLSNLPPTKNAVVETLEANYASEFHHRLTAWISTFDRSLDELHEVGVRLVSFGQSVTFHLNDIGFWNPSLITFKGETTYGDPVELIKHVSQISILLMKLPAKTRPSRSGVSGFAWNPKSHHPNDSLAVRHRWRRCLTRPWTSVRILVKR